MKKIVNLLLGSAALFVCAANTQAQTISTIIGTGYGAYAGDSGNCADARIYAPAGMAMDAEGNMYIADQYNNRIRKVDAAGIITTIAGNDTANYNGDSILAIHAHLNQPYAVAVDAKHNIYIVDRGNSRIRKIDTAGIITSIAGTGSGGYNGDNIPAKTAQIYHPLGMTVDAIGNVYFCDAGNQLVRKIDTGGMIHNFAGNRYGGYNGDSWPTPTDASLYQPSDIVIDTKGNFYIADHSNGRIRKIDTLNKISTVPCASAYAISVAVDPYGNFYIADDVNNRIIKSTGDHYQNITLAGNGTAGFSGDGGPAQAAQLSTPKKILVDSAGVVYIADWANNRIRMLTSVLAANSVSPVAGGLQVYPNPATEGHFSVSLSSATNENVQITVTNVIGQKIMTVSDATNKAINISLAQPAGIYFITATTSDGHWSSVLQVTAAH